MPKRDYSGKNLKPGTIKFLLVINAILFFVAVGLLTANLYFREEIGTVAMILVMIVTAYNAVVSWRRLKGKRI